MNICTIFIIQNFWLFHCWWFKWCQYFYLPSCLSIVLDWSNGVYNLNDVSMMMSACWHYNLTRTWKCFFCQIRSNAILIVFHLVQFTIPSLTIFFYILLFTFVNFFLKFFNQWLILKITFYNYQSQPSITITPSAIL